MIACKRVHNEEGNKISHPLSGECATETDCHIHTVAINSGKYCSHVTCSTLYNIRRRFTSAVKHGLGLDDNNDMR